MRWHGLRAGRQGSPDSGFSVPIFHVVLDAVLLGMSDLDTGFSRFVFLVVPLILCFLVRGPSIKEFQEGSGTHSRASRIKRRLSPGLRLEMDCLWTTP